MGLVQRSLVKSVLWVVAHPIFTLAFGLAVVAASAFIAHRQLDVSTDQNDLFSPKVKFFADYLRFDRLFPENQATYVVVEPVDFKTPPPVGQWVSIADNIKSKLESLGERYVRSVEIKVPLDNPNAPGLLFDDTSHVSQNFDEIKRFIPLARLWGEKPNFVTARLFGKTPFEQFLGSLNLAPLDAQTVGFVKSLSQTWAATASDRGQVIVPDVLTMGAEDPSQLGYFYVPDADPKDTPHFVLLVRVHEKIDESSLTGNADTIDVIRNAVSEVAKGYPQFKVGLTGRPVLDADENRTTDRDGRKSEIVALSVVFIGLVVILRPVWLAIVAELSLAIAIGWTFGWATVSIHRLN